MNPSDNGTLTACDNRFLHALRCPTYGLVWIQRSELTMSHNSHHLPDSAKEGAALPERFQIYVAAVLLSLQPLANGELWWQMVKGRTVVSGVWQPSRFLLINEQLPNSDWLNGTIPWIVFLFFGIAGLMLLKTGVALFVGWRLLHKSQQNPLKVFFSVIMLVAAQPVLAPSSITMDFLGILLVAALVKQQRYFSVFTCAAAWANVSTGAVWVIPTFLCFAHSGKPVGVRQAATWLVALLLFLSLTPRGLWSVVDMVLLLVPWVFNDAVFLTGTGYSSIQATIPVVAAVFLCLVAISAQGTVIWRKVLVAVLTICGLMTARHLPLAAALCGLVLLDTPRFPLWEKFQIAGLRVALCLIVFSVVIWNTTGGIDGRRERLGWGVADSVDLRFAERDLQPHRNSELLAHCTDASGVGALLMVCPTVKVMDVPEAAIRGGRLESFWLLNHDLATGRKAAFTRQNGSKGGWWRALINNNISLLVVSPQRDAIFTSLEPTLWKPLSLDSPTVVFAVAGMRQFNTQILQARSQRDLMEYGQWRHELYGHSAVPSHTDFWAAATGTVDTRADIRQACVFRGMQMPTASVRTLLPVLRSGATPSGRAEFLKTQQQFAWQEWLNCGQVSALRRAVLKNMQAEIFVAGVSANELTFRDDGAIPVDALRLYCAGELELATAEMTLESPEELFAKHAFHWEAGDARKADATLSILESGFPDHPLTAMTRLQRDVR
jgi:hypothetical protein